MSHDSTVPDADLATMVLKAVSAWGAVVLAHLGIGHWSDLAAMLASLYTFILLCEWAVKRWRGSAKERA